jgi:hypothetical protein
MSVDAGCPTGSRGAVFPEPPLLLFAPSKEINPRKLPLLFILSDLEKPLVASQHRQFLPVLPEGLINTTIPDVPLMFRMKIILFLYLPLLFFRPLKLI